MRPLRALGGFLQVWSVRPQTQMNRGRVKVRPAKLCKGLIHRATLGKL